MNAQKQMDRGLDGVYDTKGLLFLVKDSLETLQGALSGEYQENLVGGVTHSLSMAIQRLGTAIDDVEDVLKGHRLVRKDGGGMQ